MVAHSAFLTVARKLATPVVIDPDDVPEGR
jgi:hypothetical protein